MESIEQKKFSLRALKVEDKLSYLVNNRGFNLFTVLRCALVIDQSFQAYKISGELHLMPRKKNGEVLHLSDKPHWSQLVIYVYRKIMGRNPKEYETFQAFRTIMQKLGTEMRKKRTQKRREKAAALKSNAPAAPHKAHYKKERKTRAPRLRPPANDPGYTDTILLSQIANYDLRMDSYY